MVQDNLDVKRVDRVFDVQTHTWKYEDTKVDTDVQVLPGGKKLDGVDVWESFCFVIVRQILPVNGVEPTVAITIKNTHLRRVCQDVIGDIPSISWTVDPLELPVELLIAYFSRFVACRDELQQKLDRADEEEDALRAVQTLINYMERDHLVTISQIKNLLVHGEITFPFLYAIFIPGTRLITTDSATGEPRALELSSAVQVPNGCSLELKCIGLDAIDSQDAGANPQSPSSLNSQFSKVSISVHLAHFHGVVKIDALPIYPISYHPDQARLEEALLARAQKWMKFHGVHHVHYQGTAVSGTSMKYEIDSRIMIDRRETTKDCPVLRLNTLIRTSKGTFKQQNPNYQMNKGQPITQTHSPYSPDELPIILPPPSSSPCVTAQARHMVVVPHRADRSVRVTTRSRQAGSELSNEELILASPVLFGFSLSDKLWLVFNVEKIRPIEWSDEPFTNLVLPGNRRDLLRSLAEAHSSNLDFDDFVQGKGQGLVINLFGPPGVGKTLSAEATSEHLRRPLYMIGAGDLGTVATAVDDTLKHVFRVAAGWKAIVLIDEADVFLEQRSVNELARNAMVAVFLRHLEYYRGILFLTTNRIKAFDPAFLSRIHVALRFKELSKDAKQQIWGAFLHKVDVEPLTSDEFNDLVGRNVNGRQIKNATRTAMSLAKSRGEKLAYQHLVETLDAMEEFANDFAAMT